jgi:hypothetical protein
MVREGADARHGHCPDTIRRDAAGWVLDALDPVEAGQFAEHLLTCRACQLTVTELEPAARALLTLAHIRKRPRLSIAVAEGIDKPPGPSHS